MAARPAAAQQSSPALQQHQLAFRRVQLSVAKPDASLLALCWGTAGCLAAWSMPCRRCSSASVIKAMHQAESVHLPGTAHNLEYGQTHKLMKLCAGRWLWTLAAGGQPGWRPCWPSSSCWGWWQMQPPQQQVPCEHGRRLSWPRCASSCEALRLPFVTAAWPCRACMAGSAACNRSCSSSSSSSTPCSSACVSSRCAQEAGSEGEGETRFQLPQLPSPAVLLLLLGAVQEIQRAGGPALDATALHLLQWELAQACTSALR